MIHTQKTIQGKDGVNLYYETYVTKNRRPTVFFIHGVGGDLDAWRYVKDELLQHGFSSIAMDIRGHGYSSHPRSFKSYHMDNFVEDIVEILDQEKIDKIFLVGHSFGAVVVTHFAIKHQNRLNGLTIIAGTYRQPLYLSSPVLTALSNQIMNIFAFLSLPPIHPGHSVYPPGKFYKEYEWFGLGKTMMRNSWRSFLLSNKEIFTLDIESKIRNITVPTLVMVGEKDTIFPMSISEKIHKQIKNSLFEVIPGANHVVVLNNIQHVSNALYAFFEKINKNSY